MEWNKGHIFYTSITDSIKTRKSKEYVIRSKFSDESYDSLGKGLRKIIEIVTNKATENGSVRKKCIEDVILKHS